MVLQMLVQSMQPMLASLQAWLYAGLLDQSAPGFFICEGQHCIAASGCQLLGFNISLMAHTQAMHTALLLQVTHTLAWTVLRVGKIAKFSM